MALDPSITTTAANAAVDAVVDMLDAGDSAAQLRIYDGTPPANAGASLSSNTLLASLTMSDPAFGAASSAVATASAITSDTSADATGTASFFRLGSVNAGTFTPVIQGNVAASGADVNLSTASITAGGTVSISSFTYTQQGTA